MNSFIPIQKNVSTAETGIFEFLVTEMQAAGISPNVFVYKCSNLITVVSDFEIFKFGMLKKKQEKL